MVETLGRRERKKAATREKIAKTALRLFLEQGYDAVGIRDVAAAADVAVTTLFLHFPSKEALVFERDRDFEQRLVRAVIERAPGAPLIPALRREVQALVMHCATAEAAPIWRMIDHSAALREYETSMRSRHAESLASAIVIATDPPRAASACRAIASFVIDAFAIAREAADPGEALNEVFPMIEAAWSAATMAGGADPTADGSS